MAITVAEFIAASDVPAGVINILTGRISELAPHLAAHADVNALDLTGADAGLRKSLEAAAETVKRVYAPRGFPDFAAAPALPDSAPSSRSRRCGTQQVPSRSRAGPRTSRRVQRSMGAHSGPV